MYKKMAIFSVLFVMLDQGIKTIISNVIPYQSEVNVISHFFNITNVHNEGAAWSLLSGNVWFLSIVGVVALVLIYYFFLRGKQLSKLETFLYSMLIGGVVGNLIDRVVLGYVVDYLGVIIIDYHFPIFNLADIGIVVSIFIMLILSIKEEYTCKKLK